MEDGEPTATVELLGERTFRLSTRKSILEGAIEAGVPHYHACGGRAQCSTCRVYVERGAEHLSAPSAAEAALADKMKFPERVRLACQTRVRTEGGEVLLHRIVRDDADRKLFARKLASGRSMGEQRELGLFFLDIRGFTQFAESSLPFDVIHILNRFFALVRGVVARHGGRVIEVAGDGLYAVFGLEGAAEAVTAAVRAGQETLDEVARFSAAYTERYFGYRIAIGIGLHFGRVICGHVGIGVDGALSVIGYPVNVAARLQAATKELNNSFIVSKQAIARVTDRAALGIAEAEPRIVILRGVREPCAVYLLGAPYC